MYDIKIRVSLSLSGHLQGHTKQNVTERIKHLDYKRKLKFHALLHY